MLHSAIREKKLVDRCHAFGLSISYNRVMAISNKMANALCSQYRNYDLVCPPILHRNIYTVAAVDIT